MQAFLMFVHIFVSILLIIVVLLQSGKSADLAGAFGGAGSQSTFGPRGTASLLSKITTTLAILFMVTSLLLWITAAKKSKTGSVVKTESKSVITQTAPEGGQTPAEDNKPAATPTEKKEEGQPAEKPASQEPAPAEQQPEEQK